MNNLTLLKFTDLVTNLYCLKLLIIHHWKLHDYKYLSLKLFHIQFTRYITIYSFTMPLNHILFASPWYMSLSVLHIWNDHTTICSYSELFNRRLYTQWIKKVHSINLNLFCRIVHNVNFPYYDLYIPWIIHLLHYSLIINPLWQIRWIIDSVNFSLYGEMCFCKYCVQWIFYSAK